MVYICTFKLKGELFFEVYSSILGGSWSTLCILNAPDSDLNSVSQDAYVRLTNKQRGRNVFFLRLRTHQNR
jgi:hypothetical protein